MGLPDRSPMPDFFHGTMYMTFGCSRSPVTVAVPNSSRSAPAGAFWGGPAAGRPAGTVREVLTRGSPASDWAVAFAGFAAAGVGVLGAAAGSANASAGAAAGGD